MKSTTALCAACMISMLLAGGASYLCAADAARPPLRIEVAPDMGIDADIEARPLQEALAALARKGLFELKGAVPPSEVVTAHFSHMRPREALKKLMRGYNYVLLDQGPDRPPLLMLMGRIERGGSAEAGRPVAAVQPVPPPEPEPVQMPEGAPPAPPAPMPGSPAPMPRPPVPMSPPPVNPGVQAGAQAGQMVPPAPPPAFQPAEGQQPPPPPPPQQSGESQQAPPERRDFSF